MSTSKHGNSSTCCNVSVGMPVESLVNIIVFFHVPLADPLYCGVWLLMVHGGGANV